MAIYWVIGIAAVAALAFAIYLVSTLVGGVAEMYEETRAACMIIEKPEGDE
jgi:hypothetical protein